MIRLIEILKIYLQELIKHLVKIRLILLKIRNVMSIKAVMVYNVFDKKTVSRGAAKSEIMETEN